jgi:transcription factor S
MEFCPKCGSVLVPKRKNFGCARCNYSTKEKVNLSSSEKMEEKKKIEIVSQKGSEISPIIAENCKKCDNKKAFFWTVQTRAGDEAETKFFKCTKCKHTWREYR